MSDFEQTVIEAQEGENVASKWLEGQGFKVINVTQVKKFQEDDIDLLAFNDNTYVAIEVKTDTAMNKTGNVFYEFVTSNHIGCMEKTKADNIFYFDKVGKTMYSINAKRLRSFVHLNFSMLMYGYSTDGGDHSFGFKIPKDVLIQNKIMKEIFKVGDDK